MDSLRHWQGAAEAKEASSLVAFKALQEQLKQKGAQYDELVAAKTAKEGGTYTTVLLYIYPLPLVCLIRVIIETNPQRCHNLSLNDSTTDLMSASQLLLLQISDLKQEHAELLAQKEKNNAREAELFDQNELLRSQLLSLANEFHTYKGQAEQVHTLSEYTSHPIHALTVLYHV